MSDQQYPHLAIPVDKLKDYVADFADLKPDDTYIHAAELPRDAGRQRVYRDIDFERAAQDGRWGGPEHDDEHDPFVWLGLIGKHFGVYSDEILTLNFGLEHFEHSRDHAEQVAVAREMKLQVAAVRAQIVRIAALCVAQLESIDRAEGA
jgi:hypothetical protein